MVKDNGWECHLDATADAASYLNTLLEMVFEPLASLPCAELAQNTKYKVFEIQFPNYGGHLCAQQWYLVLQPGSLASN